MTEDNITGMFFIQDDEGTARLGQITSCLDPGIYMVRYSAPFQVIKLVSLYDMLFTITDPAQHPSGASFRKEWHFFETEDQLNSIFESYFQPLIMPNLEHSMQ